MKSLLPLKLAALAAAIVIAIFPSGATAAPASLERSATDAGPPATTTSTTTPATQSTASSTPSPSSPSAPPPEFDNKTFEVELKRFEAIHTELVASHARLAESIEKALANQPFVRSEVRELAFERDHAEMLRQLRSSIELLATLEALNTTATKLVADITATFNGKPVGSALTASESLRIRASETQAKIQKDLERLRTFKSAVNDTLIEDVHKYNLKISFRSLVGMSWIAAFLVMVGVFSYLLWKGKLHVPEGATMQFIAVILIVFVIILFGITDVMGENGVTGIIAAIAGYILGKSGADSSSSNIAQVIRAARGEPEPTRPGGPAT
jgi:hypothetical protein